MKISEVKNILDATVCTGENFVEREVNSAFGCDLMSDVLAFVDNHALLLTGLVNSQVIRTAEMMDMHCIIFVRGKRPTLDMIEMAEDRDMVMLCTDLEMFTACGKLYAAGLKGGSGK